MSEQINILQQQAIELLKELIATPSFSKEEEETAAIICKFFALKGIPASRVGNNIYALNKCSELCSRIGQREIKNTKLRDDYYLAAKIYAETALKIDPKNSESNCVMAIALGRSSMSKSGKEKILNAREVKKHVDAAIANDPQNFKAWHVLGRWQYEISNLNALERSLVKVLYGGLPPATIKQSIVAFEKARALRPEFILNYFEMAKAYKDNHNKNKAITYLQLMFTLPYQTEDDPVIKQKGRALLKDWQ